MKKKLAYIFLLTFFLNIHLGKATINGYLVPSTNDTVCVGTSGYVTVTGVNPSTLTVTGWLVNTTACGVWINPPVSSTSNTYTYFMVANNVYYAAILSNGDTTACFAIIVNQPSEAGSVSGGGTYCGTASGQLINTGSNGTILGWYQLVGTSYQSLSTTSPTYNFNNINAPTVYAFFTKNGVCPPDTAFAAVTVDAYSNAGTATGATTVCSSGNSGAVTTSGTVGTITGWQWSPSASGPWTSLGNSSSSYTYSNLTSPTYYHVIASNGVCPPDTSNEVLISIDTPPVAGTLTGGGSFCGTPANGTLILSGYSGTIVQWQQAPSPTGTWTATGCSGTTCSYSNIFDSQTFYRVEIDNGVCPSVYTAFDTVIYSAASVSGNLTTSDDTVCSGMQAPVLTLSGYTGNNFHWETSVDGGTTWTSLPYITAIVALPPLTDTALYRAVVKNNFCTAVTSSPVQIVVNPSPTVTVDDPEKTIMLGESVEISASGTGSPTWSSSPGLSSYTTFTTTATPLVNTTYTITVDNGNGCTNEDSVRVIVTPLEFSEFISNALTPNGDGINDAFFVRNVEAFKDSDLSIFNEYGQLLYHSAPYMNNWKGTYNGNRLPDGTYYYVLQFKNTNKTYKGNITLISQK